jgi:magnesium transporter
MGESAGAATPTTGEGGPPPTQRDAAHDARLHPMEWAEERIVLRELSMFMGVNYLITVHQEPIPELEEVVVRWERNVEAITGRGLPLPEEPAEGAPASAPLPPSPQRGGNGAAPGLGTENGIGILLYSLLDTLVDKYFPVIDAIVDRVEDLEDQIFTHYTTTSIQTIFALKKDLLALRRVLAPERDVLNVLSRRDVPIFTGQTLVYFQDVYDHVVRITDSIDTYRDLLSSTIDLYLSMQSNRLNITVQTLTSASIVLMALSLIAGIYGTNFVNIPELHWTYGYYGMLALMVLVTLLLYLFFKRKRWL